MGTSYTKQTWHDTPVVDTPINAARLGHIEDGVAAAYTFDPTGTTLVSNNQDDALRELDTNRALDRAQAVSDARAGVLLTTDQPLLVGRGNWPANSEATLGRTELSGNFNLTTGVPVYSYFTAQQSRAGVTTLTCFTALTSAGSPAPSLARIGLYSVDATTGDLTLLAGSISDAALYIGAGTVFAKTITSQALVKGTRYAVGMLQVGSTTPPKILGVNTAANVNAMTPVIAMAGPGSATDLRSTEAFSGLVGNAGMAGVFIA